MPAHRYGLATLLGNASVLSCAERRCDARGPHGGAARRRAGACAARRPRPGAFARRAVRRGCQVCSFARLTRGGALCAQAALLAPPPLPPRTDFARGAASVGAGIAALRAFAAARRRDYTEPGRVSEAERDAIEAEVSAAIRDCRERIDALKEAAPAAAAAAAAEASKHVRGGAWTRGADGGGDMLAHHTGVVLILAERLTDVAERFDRQRAARLRSSAQAATLRRRRAPLPVRAPALRCAQVSVMG